MEIATYQDISYFSCQKKLFEHSKYHDQIRLFYIKHTNFVDKVTYLTQHLICCSVFFLYKTFIILVVKHYFISLLIITSCLFPNHWCLSKLIITMETELISSIAMMVKKYIVCLIGFRTDGSDSLLKSLKMTGRN